MQVEENEGSDGSMAGDIEDSDKNSRLIESMKESVLTCAICYKLFYQPVTTPCGHTFCKRCLRNAAVVSQACPYCRRTLHVTDGSGLSVNTVLRDVLTALYPNDYCARRTEDGDFSPGDSDHQSLDDINEIGETNRDNRNNGTFGLALFPISAVVFPGQSFPMHIFELRYRLLLQRVLQTDSKFGIIFSPPNGAMETIGCIVKITNVVTLRDGRFIIDTLGVDRFSVLRTTVLDGYLVGRVRLFHDFCVSPAPVVDNIGQGATEEELRTRTRERGGSQVGETGNNELDAAEAAGQASENQDIRAAEVEVRLLLSRIRTAIESQNSQLLDTERLSQQIQQNLTDTSKVSLWLAGLLISNDQFRQRLLASQSIPERLDAVIPPLRLFAESIVATPSANSGLASRVRARDAHNCAVQ